MKNSRSISLSLALGILTATGGVESVALANTNAPRANAPGVSESGESAPMGAENAKLMSEIHEINQNEIEVGRLAKSKGTTKEVRDFGERLIQDHTKADRMITDLAKREKVDLKAQAKMKTPQEEKEAAEEKSTLESLKKASGVQFDTLFTKEMVSGHKAAIQKLTVAEARLPADSELRITIQKILPLLTQHEQIAMTLAKKQAA